MCIEEGFIEIYHENNRYRNLGNDIFKCCITHLWDDWALFPELFPSPHSAKDSNDLITTVPVEQNEMFLQNPVPDDVLYTLKDTIIRNIGRIIIATNVNSQ